MSTEHAELSQQQSHSTALQPRTTTDTDLLNNASSEPQGPNHGQNHDEHILVHFNGHFNGQFNGAFILPNNMYQHATTESDAQIAARRAMAKRNSRSLMARMSRSRSRKMEVVGRSIKPGITVDTSFARHRGNAPHQVYPQNNPDRSDGHTRKHSWFGLGRSSIRTKGLGISKGTPQPGRSEVSPSHQDIFHRSRSSADYASGTFGAEFSSPKDPMTASSTTAGSKTWQEISPWDRPIPIGISIPSDSMPDFSPYQTSRQRSDSDATLTTPSIIITPADAMKSVWSPDTASDYTPARGSSIYSRATFNMQGSNSYVPPVPALPADVYKYAGRDGLSSHTRNDTLDSVGTAFEEEDDDKQKERVMSSSTFFEEDDTPLRDKTPQSTLTVDTSVIPTPRRSQGWWNVITTPFVMSRSNSIWTQGGLSAQKTPDMPTMPVEYEARKELTFSPTTYTWSADEKSTSIRGDSPLLPPSLPTTVPTPEVNGLVVSSWGATARNGNTTNDLKPSSVDFAAANQDGARDTIQQSPPLSVQSKKSPSSTVSATPVVGNTQTGAVSMAHRMEDQTRTVNVNIELQVRRSGANTSPSQTVHVLPAQTQFSNAVLPMPSNNATQQAVPVFPPPPTSAHKVSHFSYEVASRSNTPVSAMDVPKVNPQKQHRKVENIFSRLVLCRRKKEATAGNDKKKPKRSRCFLYCGCCIIILVLLAIILPVVVVFTKKSNGTTKDAGPGPDPGPGSGAGPSQELSSQWLNLTGYPPIPTGISTIAQPEASEEQNGCVAPATMWSCALPKEQHADISPNKPDQPNFKLEITFENGTVADPSKTRPTRRAANPVSAGAFIRTRLHMIRDALSPAPAPPDVEERKFLGQTTEKNIAPFEGEDTPFFISFQEPKSTTASRLAKRATDPDDPTNITSVIPPPELNSDGTAAPANLLPFPFAQPLRLFNRGKPDEHYGFYTFFDRSIFLKEITNDLGRGGNPADTDGGSLRDAAKLRCTFTQTRFLVQIWTQSAKTKPLLGVSAQKGSDNMFERPGTFPYPVTVTLDRHGGEFKKKNLFCYKMENDATIVDKSANKFFWFEDRTFGGNLVNGTQGKPDVQGPIDGGSGGCGCKWQNWLD
jgi:hypothetical protein